MMKPVPWPEGTFPTVEQWLPWFLSLEHQHQHQVAESLLLASQDANTCLANNHIGRLEQCEAHNRYLFGLLERRQREDEVFGVKK